MTAAVPTAALVLFAVYAIVPDLWARARLRRVRRPTAAARRLVALTFDDGPDPGSTPTVMHILREKGAAATFFCIGKKVDACPSLVQALAADGHEVATHGFSHRHAWTMGPLATLYDIRRGKDSIRMALGKDPGFYRPPWGVPNVLTAAIARRLGLGMALYDVEARDWLPADRAGDIAARVRSRVYPGAIILLHDAGGAPGACENLIRTLPTILDDLLGAGYTPVRLSEMIEKPTSPSADPPGARASAESGSHPLVLAAWVAWERLFARIAAVIPLTESIHVAPYRCRSGRGPGSIGPAAGDLCLDVHLHSAFFAAGSRSARETYRRISRDFQQVADALRTDERFADVRMLTAISLYYRQAGSAGFHVEELEPAWRRRWFSRYMRFILWVYNPAAYRRLAQRRDLPEVRCLWATREEFLARWPTRETSRQP